MVDEYPINLEYDIQNVFRIALQKYRYGFYEEAGLMGLQPALISY